MSKRIVGASFVLGLCAAATAAFAAPDISGTWGHNGFGFNVPYITRTGGVVDGYNNPILKPWTVEAILKNNFAEKAGRLIPSTHTTCYPDSVPGVFALREMQVLQSPKEVTLIFRDDMQVRHVYLDKPHSAHVVPSWAGESVGHWDGDTLVVDTIGLVVNPQARVDRYGTPHTSALHVVERFQLVNEEGKENEVVGRPNVLNNGGLDKIIAAKKSLQLNFTVEDPGVFKKPWSSRLDYRPIAGVLGEMVCAENNRDWRPLIPTADVADF